MPVAPSLPCTGTYDRAGGPARPPGPTAINPLSLRLAGVTRIRLGAGHVLCHADDDAKHGKLNTRASDPLSVSLCRWWAWPP